MDSGAPLSTDTDKKISLTKVKSSSKAASERRLNVCLAGSGGGHLRQLFDLEPAVAGHHCFFVSEDTALSRSISEKHRVYYLPHFALGQARLGAPVKMALAGIRSLFLSALIVWRERPDVLISTGAGAVFFPLVWARLLGAKIVVVESFARFDKPSVFGRLTARLAHKKVVQSAGLAKYWPDAAVFDPLKLLEIAPPTKRHFMFATVGAILPFDRMVDMVADLKRRGLISEDLLIQTGVGGVVPEGIETVETLTFDEIQTTLKEADIVVCHGGSGSLITALRQGCRIVAVPRLFEKGEVYDNHQSEITQAFAERGLICVANTADELAAALIEVRGKPPVPATSDPSDLIEHLKSLLAQWASET